MEGNPPVPKVHERSFPVPIEKEGMSHIPMTTPLSILVTSFNWSRLAGYHLPSYVPFEIIVQAYHMAIASTVIDEGAPISILSSTVLQALVSPHLVLVTQNLLSFNRGTTQPLGILPKFRITFGGNIVYMDMMVFQGPLDFNLLLCHDYVYIMGDLVSSLFQVTCFPHEGSIAIIDQPIFIGLESTPDEPSSLNGSYVQEVSPLR